MSGKKRTKGKILRYRDREYDVVKENGKYFFCDDAQFRKANPMIEVTKRKVEKKEEEE